MWPSQRKTPMNLHHAIPHGFTQKHYDVQCLPGLVNIPKTMERSTIFWCVNQLFRLGHGFKFAFCKRLPGRVNSKIFQGFDHRLQRGATTVMWSSGNRCAAQMALVPVGSDRIWKAQACREVEAQGPSQGPVLKGQNGYRMGPPILVAFSWCK